MLKLFLAGMVSMLLTADVFAASARLTWRDNSDNETGFQIERATGSGPFVQIGTVGANVASYTDETLVYGTTYMYRVLAFNAYGNSDYSNVATFTAPLPLPGTVIDLMLETPQ